MPDVVAPKGPIKKPVPDPPDPTVSPKDRIDEIKKDIARNNPEHDPRIILAKELEEEAQILRLEVENEIEDSFPKIGDEIKIKDVLLFGTHDRLVSNESGVIIYSVVDQKMVVVEFPSILVKCGECKQMTKKETIRVNVNKLVGF